MACKKLLLVRRNGQYSPYVLEDLGQFEGRVEMLESSNELRISSAEINDNGKYIFEIEPSNAQAYDWSQDITIYKRPEYLRIDQSENYKKESAVQLSDDSAYQQEEFIASCIAAGAVPPMKLSWISEDGTIVVPSDTEPIKQADGTFTSHLDLNIIPKSSYNGQIFKCTANQLGIPQNDNQIITEQMIISVLFKPENTKLELVPLDTNTSADASNVVREVVCRSNANPKPVFNITMPNGEQRPRSGKSSAGNDFKVDFSSNGQMYQCTASNRIGSETVAKSVNDLLSLNQSGFPTLWGLPIWTWVIIILSVIMFMAVLVVWCCNAKDKKGGLCFCCDNSAPRKPKSKKRGISKNQISMPQKTQGLLDTVSSRQGLQEIHRRHSNDNDSNESTAKQPIINQMAQNGGISYAPVESIQNHMAHLNQQQKTLNENQHYIQKSQELLQDDEYDQHAEMDVDAQINNENQHLLGHETQPDHFDQQFDQNNNRHSAHLQNPTSNQDTAETYHLENDQYNPNLQNMNNSNNNMPETDNYNDMNNMPQNFMRNTQATSSNRPYSEIYGYSAGMKTQTSGIASSINTHTGCGV